MELYIQNRWNNKNDAQIKKVGLLKKWKFST